MTKIEAIEWIRGYWILKAYKEELVEDIKP